MLAAQISTAEIIAIAAGGVAVVALACAGVLALALRRLARAQRLVLGEHGQRDLVAHAGELQRAFSDLREYVETAAGRFEQRADAVERRLDGAVAHHGLVRYDAYNEMSGHQSLSLALLDSTRTGIVLSSIHHRDQARLYAKQISGGTADLTLSPEEEAAVRLALGDADA